MARSRRSLRRDARGRLHYDVRGCDREWFPEDEERWRSYHVGDDLDQPAELGFYCPECAEREFELNEGGTAASPATVP